MIPRIGFSLQKQYDIPLSKIIPLLKKHGFDAVSPVWYPELDVSALSACVKSYSMTIQSIHAPHKGIPLLWSHDIECSSSVLHNILSSIDDCARFGIPILVMHGWTGFLYDFDERTLNFANFDHIVQHAEKQKISIAFENLEGEEFLNALMMRYRSCDNVGYCWDSGHDFCYPHETDFLKKFGERLIMTHLNDNFGLRSPEGIPTGDDDLHLLPYDGAIDWDKAISKLRAYKKQNILNFELKTVSHSKKPSDLIYANLPIEDFIKEAGKRARIICEKYAALFTDEAN